MMNRPLLLILIFIWVAASATSAQALLLQGPNELYSPYPYVLSRPIDILPQGSITINVGDETYYYCKGIFYQKIVLEQKYVIVPPPIGAVVFTIPQGYQLMLINGTTYYEYEGVYYKRDLEGYKVIYPPV